MVVKYNRDNLTDYTNVLEIIALFLMAEFIEYLKFFNAYDPVNQEYNIRRVIWVMGVTLTFIQFIGLIALTCITYLIGKLI